MIGKILAIGLALLTGAAAERPPNVVVIMTDDQGYGDVGVFGAEGYATPHLDRMAAEGRRFTRFYAAQAVCSASRAALLTGCYPNRVGIQGALGPDARIGLSPEETTLAEVCRKRGFATACFGKWHLGDVEEFLPLNQGFDEYFGIPYSNDMWPQHPTAEFKPLPLIEGNRQVRIVDEADQKMMTTRLTARAVEFIGRHRDQPFFLYVAHPQPHVPLFVSERFDGSTERGLYGDVIAELDWSVGEILNAIDTYGLGERTLVIFTSDNGPWLSYGEHAGSSGGLREGKGTAWEGGVREPTIARWTGKIAPGTVCDVPLMNIDILPTVAGLIGAEPPQRKIDGLDVGPLLLGEEGAENPHEGYWFYYGRNELQAVSMGDWKLVFPHRYRTIGDKKGRGDGMPIKYDSAEAGLELYHLADDPAEANDLSESQPEKVAELRAFAEKARAELGDSLTGVENHAGRGPGRLTGE